MMSRFYLQLWFAWLFRVVTCTLLIAFSFALLITLFLYIKEGMPSLNTKIIEAVFDIWLFWFQIMLNISLLIALFRSVKYLFNKCYAAYAMKLKACSKNSAEGYIEPVGYGDLVKVWRKWFMLLIWIVGSFMVLATAVSYLFMKEITLFSWFNIYILYAFIAIGAYFSFLFLESRCKNIKVIKCTS